VRRGADLLLRSGRPAVAAVGFSQGGLMATQLLRTRPERVAAIVVLSGFVQAAPPPGRVLGTRSQGPHDPNRCDRADTPVADRPLHPHRARLPSGTSPTSAEGAPKFHPSVSVTSVT
jgi:pimeloyl-ACP methyl ester carboxylesterase